VLEHEIRQAPSKLLSYVAVGLALAAVLFSALSFFYHGSTDRVVIKETALSRIKRTGVMRVGYGGFPPYTIVDPRESDPNKRVSGFTVDMVNEIAARFSPAVKVEWYNLDWDTFASDMQAGKFDFVGDAVYETIPKASDFSMTEPFSYFGLAVALVRSSDDRFSRFEDLDRSDITIALAQGYVSTDYAEHHLLKPHFQLVPVGKDAFNQLDQVLLGKADVALQDVPTVVQYVRAHPGKVKALWLDHPPSTVPGGFVTKDSDQDLLNFLNVSIRILSTDGTLDRLDKKWNSLGYYLRPTLIPGAGLTASETQ
jgi:ABC-type amino acid transport substrate-binding protein